MDIDLILSPLPGDRPSGENLRYTAVYDEITEARRADDLLAQGDWKHEVKTSDWDKTRALCEEALASQSKDLQIAAWFVESLAHTDGFHGVSQGLTVITGFLNQFWDSVYPEIEDDDLDYRVGPLEFMNDKLWLAIKEIPMTDPSHTNGFSWLKWQESRQVGSEKDTLNQYGDVDDDKKKAREGQIAEGKLPAEEFDLAVKRSSRAWYEDLFDQISQCVSLFNDLDNTVDETFGREAPRLAELKTSLQDCLNLVTTIVKVKRKEEPDPEPEPNHETNEEPNKETVAAAEKESEPQSTETDSEPLREIVETQAPLTVETRTMPAGIYQVNRILGSAGIEEAVWQDALKKLGTDGIKPALEQLLGASCSAQSVREKTNFRLLMARLCLKADRPDLARPIMEELNTLIEELALEKWESPIWIAEALGTLYQCLTAEGSTDDDLYRAEGILTRLCTLDITKAMEYSNRGIEQDR